VDGTVTLGKLNYKKGSML